MTGGADPLTGGQEAFLLALAARLVPWSSDFDAGRRREFAALIAGTLATRPAAMRRQFAIFLTLLRWAPALRYGRRLDRLDAARQDAVLRWFQDSPITLVRAGFWGVRTLVFLGCYGQPGVHASLGYRPSPDGNAELHARSRR